MISGALTFFRQDLRYVRDEIIWRQLGLDLRYIDYTILGLALVIIFFLVILYSYTGRIINLLTEIYNAIEQIDDDNDKLIIMSNDLRFFEHQLNTLKQALQRRSREAKQAEQQKSDLVVYLAHDLKTPLTSIIGYSSIIQETADLPLAINQKYNGIVYKKAKHMEMLLDELFEVTRFNTQTITLNQRLIDLNMMLEQLAEEFYPELIKKQLTVEFKADRQYKLILDSDQMARVFDNLLRNALHYSEEGSVIKIALFEQEKKIRIVFSNYGVTIAPDKLSRIFDKFYRTDDARSSTTGGSGLGLAIAKIIVEAHEGTITALSENLWTTFIIELPNTADAEHQENNL